jgi:hypothetical protein
MTNAERNRKILHAIDQATTKAVSSRQAARQMLIAEGIYTAKGQLRAEFGGTGRKAKPAA